MAIGGRLVVKRLASRAKSSLAAVRKLTARCKLMFVASGEGLHVPLTLGQSGQTIRVLTDLVFDRIFPRRALRGPLFLLSHADLQPALWRSERRDQLRALPNSPHAVDEAIQLL